MEKKYYIRVIIGCFIIALVCVYFFNRRERFAFEPVDPRPPELAESLLLKEPLIVGVGETKIPGQLQLLPDSHYKFQIDYYSNREKYRDRRFPVFGIDSDLFRFDPAHLCSDEEQWRTISHYFRTPREKTVSKIVFQADDDGTVPEQYRNLSITPALLLNNTVRKNENFGDLYGDSFQISGGPIAGDFLPLGHLERIEKDYEEGKSKGSIYEFRPLEQDYCRGVLEDRLPVLPPQEADLRPVYEKKLHASSQHNTRDWYFDKESRLVLRFEFRPIRIMENGDYRILPPKVFSPKELWFTHYSRKSNATCPLAEISDNGVFWRKLKNANPDPASEFLTTLSGKKTVLYIRLSLDNAPEGLITDINQFRFTATFPDEDYLGWGKHHFFDLAPSELQSEPSKTLKPGCHIRPLFQATNMFYFLCKNDSDTTWKPGIRVKHRYAHAELAENVDNVAPFKYHGPYEERQIEFVAIGNKTEKFEDIDCSWQIAGSPDGSIPPHSERIAVYTLETDKLRASSHAQHGPAITDTLETEFDLGEYRMKTPTLSPFPPRTWIE